MKPIDITITVSGKTGSGKSLICNILKQQLQSSGVEVIMGTGFEPELDNLTEDEITKRIANISDRGFTVKIVEQHLIRANLHD